MQVKTLLTGFAATAALCLAGVASGEAEYTWTGDGTGGWTDPDSWDCTGLDCGTDTYPGQNDNEADVVIPSDVSPDPYPVLSASLANPIATLEIQNGATLTIQDDGELEIEDAGGLSVVSGGEVVIDEVSNNPGLLILSGGGTHQIDGEVTLAAANATLRIDASATFSFDSTPGIVQGENNDALVEIALGATLTNNVAFEGGMMFEEGAGIGDAVFVNARIDANSPATTGIVQATEEMTIEFDADVLVQDLEHQDGMRSHLPIWAAIGSSSFDATLRFNASYGDCGGTPLVGDFVLDDGILCLDDDDVVLQTSGDLDTPGGSNWEIRGGTNSGLFYLCANFQAVSDTCDP